MAVAVVAVGSQPLLLFRVSTCWSAGGDEYLLRDSFEHKATSQRVKTKPVIRLTSMVYFFCSYLKFVAGLTDGE